MMGHVLVAQTPNAGHVAADGTLRVAQEVVAGHFHRQKILTKTDLRDQVRRGGRKNGAVHWGLSGKALNGPWPTIDVHGFGRP